MSKKVKKGGIIAGHDYIRRNRPTFTHVVEAVHAYTTAYDIKPWFVLGSRDKSLDPNRDKARSWFWVNP